MQVSMFDGIVVVTTSVGEIEKKYGAFTGTNFLYSSGGFAATVYGDDHEKEMEEKGVAIPECDRMFIESMRNTPFIFRVSDAMELLTEAEIEAFMWHEVGHIRRGHVEEAKTQKVRGVVQNVQYELEADAYAAQRCGKKVMAVALTKVLTHLCKQIGFDHTKVLMGADVRARINALQ